MNIIRAFLYLIKIYSVVGLRLFSNKALRRREDIPILLSILNLRGEGAEIGVGLGEFSEHILQRSQLKRLYSIDPWTEYEKKDYESVDAVSELEYEARYAYTRYRLKKYKKRSEILKMDSKEASKSFRPQSLDFVYIDANHAYENCKEDLEHWWPKLKDGGLFAGHDYLDGRLPQGEFGVKRAVDEFTAKYGQNLSIIKEEWPGWYITKRKERSTCCVK
jgi:predicted O-methyltransferase YrrM